ncbi:uncharacterized protein CBO05P1_048 [Clostridium botulinum B str. Osaka05]|uniref:Uncharacterized protein n=1 Tax=Clostridium botulinum B str. Osaka05 TaxID=1407017 RepID=A0A060N4R2_CLOBO|nr:hypothetical protein [Clostridium botulinum]BAO04767.1 uncharacterized protein CBO05P1_048 [Clostridium botulinum B str. Osaka05]
MNFNEIIKKMKDKGTQEYSYVIGSSCDFIKSKSDFDNITIKDDDDFKPILSKLDKILNNEKSSISFRYSIKHNLMSNQAIITCESKSNSGEAMYVGKSEVSINDFNIDNIEKCLIISKLIAEQNIKNIILNEKIKNSELDLGINNI